MGIEQDDNRGIESQSRRDFLEKSLKIGAIAGVAATIGLSETNNEGEAEPNSEIRPNVVKAPENYHLDLFKRLDGIIDSTEGLSLEKENAKVVANYLKKIMEVNDAFFEGYSTDLDESGRKRLLTKYESKFLPVGVYNPESMIFIVNNNRQAEKQIINPLANLLNSGQPLDNANAIFNELVQMSRVVNEDEGDAGELRYLQTGEVRRHITLKDYVNFNSKTGGSLEIDFAEGVDKNQVPNADEKIKLIESIYGDRAVAGNLRINIFPNGGDYDEGENINPHIWGEFRTSDEGSIVNLHVISDTVLIHEARGHYGDPLLNDQLLIQYFSPEVYYQLLLKREEALSSEEWGRNYPDVKKAFRRHSTYTPEGEGNERSVPTATIKPPGGNSEITISELRRGSTDTYPDKIFYTGYDEGFFTENAFLIKKSDHEVLKANSSFFEDQETTSVTFGEFMNKEETKYLFDTISERSEWQGKIVGKLRELAPVIDAAGLTWLRVTKPAKKEGEAPEVVVPAPSHGARDTEWFQFYSTLGQRLAVIDMFANEDPVLSLLPESEYDEFSHNLIRSLMEADNECFANMMTLSILKSPNTKSDTPDPYQEYEELFNSSIVDKTESTEN